MFLDQLSIYSTYLPILIFLWKRPKQRSVWVFLFYIIYTIINDKILSYADSAGILTSNPKLEIILLSLFTVVEYSCLAITLNGFIKNRIYKKLLKIVSIAFYIIAILNFYINITSTQGTTQKFDIIPIASSAIISLSFCILALFEEMQNPVIGFIYNTFKFWIILGIMIYFAGTFFFFLYFTTMGRGDKDFFWNINWISIILKNIFFSIAFLMPDEDPNREYYQDEYSAEN